MASFTPSVKRDLSILPKAKNQKMNENKPIKFKLDEFDISNVETILQSISKIIQN